MAADTLPGGTFTMTENPTVTNTGYGAARLTGTWRYIAIDSYQYNVRRLVVNLELRDGVVPLTRAASGTGRAPATASGEAGAEANPLERSSLEVS